MLLPNAAAAVALPAEDDDIDDDDDYFDEYDLALAVSVFWLDSEINFCFIN